MAGSVFPLLVTFFKKINYWPIGKIAAETLSRKSLLGVHAVGASLDAVIRRVSWISYCLRAMAVSLFPGVRVLCLAFGIFRAQRLMV